MHIMIQNLFIYKCVEGYLRIHNAYTPQRTEQITLNILPMLPSEALSEILESVIQQADKMITSNDISNLHVDKRNFFNKVIIYLTEKFLKNHPRYNNRIIKATTKVSFVEQCDMLSKINYKRVFEHNLLRFTQFKHLFYDEYYTPTRMCIKMVGFINAVFRGYLKGDIDTQVNLAKY